MKKLSLLTLLCLTFSLTGCVTQPAKQPDNGNENGGESGGEQGHGGEETPTLTDIVVTNPTKIVYTEGEDLDLTGFKVIATYSDGSTNDVTSEVTVTGYNKNSVGTQNITVTYQGINKSFSVTVNQAVPTGGYGYNHFNGYYGQLTWTDSEDLIEKLHSIISQDVNYLRYDASSSVPTNWETNTDADHAYDDLEMLDVVYSNVDVPTSQTNSGWQREHAFVASLMTGVTTSNAVGAKQGRAVDFHNLFAGDTHGNTSRSDKNFGAVEKDDPNYTGYQKEDGCFESNNKVFEPSDEDKGKLSRAILYMLVMYNADEEEDITLTLNYNAEDKATYGQNSKAVHIPMNYKPLSLNEGLANNELVNFTNYHYAETEAIQTLVAQYGAEEAGYANYVRDNAAYSIGIGSDILSWATTLPVDIQEYQHNQSVYSHVHSGYLKAQNNRNPFVDYPELVSYAFGDKKNQAGDLNNLRPTTDALSLENEGIHHYAIKTATREFEVGDTFDSNSYELVGIKNDFSQVAVTGNIDSTPAYTFTASDIGEKTLNIITDKNTIELKVNIKAKANQYSYSYVFSSKDDFGGSNFAKDETREVTLAGKKWNAVATNAVTLSNKASPFSALQIGAGTSGKNADKFTLVSADSFTNVNRIKLSLNAAANKTYNVSVKIGTTEVKSFTYTGNSQELIVNEFDVNPNASGVVTIEFTNVSAALYINTIAINEVK